MLLPFYYRNAEVILHAIGIERGASLERPAPDHRPRVLFHGDSITHGHGVTSPRETYVWQVAQKLNCVPFNYGFGGSAWADNVVAQTIAEPHRLGRADDHDRHKLFDRKRRHRPAGNCRAIHRQI